MRALLVAVPIAIAICAATPALADAQSQVQAARKAEHRGEWKKALEHWKAAYAAEVNAEYLIGIGDCYSKLGYSDEARKNYNAYLADPLALPGNVEKVKIKVASLDRPAGALALPGSDSPSLPLAAAPLPGLDLPGTAAADRKGKSRKGGATTPPLPGLDLPGTAPAQVADKKDSVLVLPGLDLPGTAPAKKEKVAATSPALELPGLPLPGATTPAKGEKPAVASNAPTATRTSTGKLVAIAATPPSTTQKTDSHRVPQAAIAETPVGRSQAEASSGTSRTVAFVAAGVAVVALGGGALAFTKAGSAHSELTSKVHDGATAQSLLETESKNKTLSFVGFAGGLVAAGIATALFAF